MHRIDTSTAQADKFGEGKNGFTGGNPQTGELPTAMDADYFDSIQEEICGVIEAAGIALDKTQRNQLLTALPLLFLSRANPFADIKADGAAAIATALANLGLGNIVLAGVCGGQLSTNGYIQIPAIIGGVKRMLLIQWGKISVDYTASHSSYTTVGGAVSKYTGTLTFPVAFPTACFNIVGVSNDSNNLFTAGMYATSLSSASWSLVSGQGYSSTGSGNNTISWLSIGY
ncbi:hypothetical protein ABC733_28620 [Mangrovibacter sp. SLW1]